jgi:hypothetical protein
MAGYSITSPTKKLGIKEGSQVLLLNAPKNFESELSLLPSEVRFVTRASKAVDLILLFARSQSALNNEFAKLAAKIAPNGTLWIVWPKKSSGVSTDLSFNSVQRIGLDAGLVDVKVCAINDVWSGLKFVYRLRDRKKLS